MPRQECNGGGSLFRKHSTRLDYSYFAWLFPTQPSYRYVVTFDDASTLNDSGNLTFSCAGSAGGCGCVDVTGAIEGPGGSRVGCGTATLGSEDTSTSAKFNNSDCLVQATVDVSMLLEGGETYVGGSGSLAFSGAGEFLLPSLVEADIEVRSLAEVVVPRRSGTLTGTVNVTSGGVLWFSGGRETLRSAIFTRCGFHIHTYIHT